MDNLKSLRERVSKLQVREQVAARMPHCKHARRIATCLLASLSASCGMGLGYTPYRLGSILHIGWALYSISVGVYGSRIYSISVGV